MLLIELIFTTIQQLDSLVKNYSQLMDGVDYGGVQIDTATFGANTGFDRGDKFGINQF